MWGRIYKEGMALGLGDLALVSSEKLDMERIFSQRKSESRELPIEEENISLRLDPNLLLEGARSVVVAFLPIPSTLALDTWEEGYGNLASISWEEDYHIALKKILVDLDGFIRNEVGEGYRSHIQIDTGPLYERGMAQRSKRGFIGKNGSFIHQDLGSFVSLGLIICNCDLGPTATDSGVDSCGDCRACIEACPGHALSNKGVDPRRCRSWISQKKEGLEAWEREILGPSLYGCDICQRVCPKNLRAKGIGPGPGAIKKVHLDTIKSLSNREFKKMFGHLSGSWRGLKLWKRNGEIVHDNFNKHGII